MRSKKFDINVKDDDCFDIKLACLHVLYVNYGIQLVELDG